MTTGDGNAGTKKPTESELLGTNSTLDHCCGIPLNTGH